MSYVWILVGGLLLWWLFRRPQQEPVGKNVYEKCAACEICGDIFPVGELKTMAGAPERRCPACYSELQSLVRGIERESRPLRK